MMTFGLRLGLMLVLAMCPVVAVAEEPAQAPWRFEGVVWQGDARHASVDLRIERADAGALTASDEIKPIVKGGASVRATAVLDDAGHARSGSYRRVNRAGFLEGRWSVADDGRIALVHKTQEYENDVDPQGRGPVMTTLASLVRWAAPADGAPEHATRTSFDPDPDGGDRYVAKAQLQRHGPARWATAQGPQRLATSTVTRGQRTYRLAYDSTGQLVGMEIEGMGISVAVAGMGPVRLDDRGTHLASPAQLARSTAQVLRAGLPMPSKPYRYEGTVALDGCTIGQVRIEATPSSLGGVPTWRVSEESVRRGGAAEVRSETLAWLAQDLSLIRGETLHRAPSGWRRSTYEVDGARVRMVHEGPEGRSAPTVGVVRPGSVVGIAPVLLLLRDAPGAWEAGRLALPGFDPRFVKTPKTGSGNPPSDLADLQVEIAPAGPRSAHRSVHVRSRLGYASTYDLDLGTGALLGRRGQLPRSTWVPRGTGGPAPDWFDAIEGTPQSAHQAFIRFGRGYHMARRDLLAVSFDWDRMLQRGMATGAWPQGTTRSAFTESWMGEFVARSKHRTPGDCDDLLLQVFLTMQIVPEEDGSVTFATLPVYGGHRYRLASVALEGEDQRPDASMPEWRIVQVD